MAYSYVPVDVMAKHGPRGVTGEMYNYVILMMGEVIPLVYDIVQPVIGKFEMPPMGLKRLSQIGRHGDRFGQAARDFKEAIEKNEGRSVRSDEIPEYFDAALGYLADIGFYERANLKDIDWPTTMTFHKMEELKKKVVDAFKSNA